MARRGVNISLVYSSASLFHIFNHLCVFSMPNYFWWIILGSISWKISFIASIWDIPFRGTLVTEQCSTFWLFTKELSLEYLVILIFISLLAPLIPRNSFLLFYSKISYYYSASWTYFISKFSSCPPLCFFYIALGCFLPDMYSCLFRSFLFFLYYIVYTASMSVFLHVCFSHFVVLLFRSFSMLVKFILATYFTKIISLNAFDFSPISSAALVFLIWKILYLSPLDTSSLFLCSLLQTLSPSISTKDGYHGGVMLTGVLLSI